MCYRLVRGDTLMRKILSDSAQAISLLYSHPRIDTGKIGLLGHSYGGNTVLFHGALDTRVQFSCASGAACSYEYKLENDVGIEMAEVIPGFASHFDIQDLVACFAPRKVMLVSASEDKYSMDAEQIITLARETCEQNNVSDHSEHIRYDGMHALTQDRFGKIVEWLVRCVD